MEFRTRRHHSTPLDITPVVDMVFNLLIFFALSFNFNPSRALQIMLPTATATSPAPAHSLRITIGADGALGADGAPLAADQLKALLQTALQENPAVTLLIRADQAAAHGRVVEVMEMCRAAGCSQLAIETRCP